MLHRPDSLETTMKPSSHSRREFAKVAGAALAGLAAAPSIAANPRSAQTAPPIATVGGRDPDAIVVNAKVYTMDTRAPRAEAFAVTNGRFTAVGSTGDIKGLAGKSTQTFDAKGMTVVPGFIDCHNHAGGEVLLNEVLVGNPFEVEFVTIRSIVDKLKAKAQQTPPGTWVEGFFFDDTKVKDKRALEHPGPGRGVQRSSCDRSPPRRPHVLLQQQGVRDGRGDQDHRGRPSRSWRRR